MQFELVTYSDIPANSPSTNHSTIPVNVRQIVETPIITPNETDHILSVTIRLYVRTNSASIYYTLDGSSPDVTNPNSRFLYNDDPIYLNRIGSTLISAIAIKEGMENSLVVRKEYIIRERCTIPRLRPNGGVFAGSVQIYFISETPGSTLCYSINDKNLMPLYTGEESNCIQNNEFIALKTVGQNVVKVVVIKEGFAPSDVTTAYFTILPKVETPVIGPPSNVFTILALITISCSTPNSTIHFTLDGSDPNEASLILAPGENLVIENSGQHIIKAFATEQTMLSSDISVKTILIQERAQSPSFIPIPGKYVGDLHLYIHCHDESGNKSQIFYTTDGFQTPTVHSDFIYCFESIFLKSPGKFLVRAFVSKPNFSPSSIVQGEYELSRPSYDEYPIHNIFPFTVQPDLQVYVVEKDFPSFGGYCETRNVRGRLVELKNPLGHFDIVQPYGGCRKGNLELPSISGRNYTPSGRRWDLRETAADPLNMNRKRLFKSFYRNISELNIKRFREEFEEVSTLGCQVVTNAGFFNVTSGVCLGDVVSNDRIWQTSNKHNVNFGLRNGLFVTGYVDAEEIRNATNPFDTLISGLIWLVRNGESYVSESLSLGGDAEDMSGQSTGRMFATVKSARTAIGYNRDGNLLILQVEGETWVRGMTLYEFAAFAVDLGFYSAINLDGGGSATMTFNHTLVSEPSWKCADTNNSNPLGYYRCEKKVSTITCIHAAAPPITDAEFENDKDSDPHSWIPTVEPTETPQQPSNSPVATRFPTKREPLPIRWTTYPTKPSHMFRDDDNSIPTEGIPKEASNNNNNSSEISIFALEEAVKLYKYLSYALGVLLFLSVIMNFYACSRGNSDGNKVGVGNRVELSSDEEDYGVPHHEQFGIQMQMPQAALSSLASTGIPISDVHQPSSRRNTGDKTWQTSLKNINLDYSDNEDDPDRVVSKKDLSRNNKKKTTTTTTNSAKDKIKNIPKESSSGISARIRNGLSAVQKTFEGGTVISSSSSLQSQYIQLKESSDDENEGETNVNPFQA